MAVPKTPLLTADCVVIDSTNRVLMIRRKNPPYEGRLALPGGFVEIDETVESAARRELKEETGIDAENLQLVGVYSDPQRDPRGHVCSVAFLARAGNVEPKAGDDADAAIWVKDPNAFELAFDHRKIIADAIRLARGRN